MSKKFKLSKKDLRAQLKAAVVWLAPLAILYFAQLQGSLVDKKVLSWSDFVPNEMTVGAIQLYAVNQAYGLFNRFVSGK